MQGWVILDSRRPDREEPTLCKNHPSAGLRAGPSAPVKHAGRKKRAGLRASKGAAPRMHLGRFARAMSNRSDLAPKAE